MLNKNDLLKLLINSDKENFTDEEIVELLGIKVKSEGVKSSSIQSSCIFSNEVVADIDDTFNSSIFEDTNESTSYVSSDFSSLFIDENPRDVKSIPNGDSEQRLYSSQQGLEVLNYFKNNPNVLQCKREISLIKRLIGYVDPTKRTVANSKILCVRNIVNRECLDFGNVSESKTMLILDNFLKRRGLDINRIADNSISLYAILNLFEYYEVPVNVAVFAICRDQYCSSGALNSEIGILVDQYVLDCLRGLQYDGLLTSYGERIVDFISSNNYLLLENLVYNSRDRISLKAYTKLKYTVKSAHIVYRALYEQKCMFDRDVNKSVIYNPSYLSDLLNDLFSIPGKGVIIDYVEEMSHKDGVDNLLNQLTEFMKSNGLVERLSLAKEELVRSFNQCSELPKLYDSLNEKYFGLFQNEQ